MKTKLKQVRAMQKQFGNSFREACLLCGYSPDDPDLKEEIDMPSELKEIFGPHWGSE